jgi:hypothetical protein
MIFQRPLFLSINKCRFSRISRKTFEEMKSIPQSVEFFIPE